MRLKKEDLTIIQVQETQLQAGMIQPSYSIHVVKGDSCLHILLPT